MRSNIIIFAGITLLAAGAAGLYTAYSSENAGSALISWAGIIIGALAILYGFGKRVSDEMSPQDNAASNQGQAEIRALIQCMGMVAVADKQVRDAEVETIARIHEQMLGLKISEGEVREILSEFNSDFDIKARLQRDMDLINPTMRRTIIQSCHLVMVSDLEVVTSEESRIYEIASTLGYDKNDVDDMISAVAT